MYKIKNKFVILLTLVFALVSSCEDLDKLKLANQMFGVGDEILTAKKLIEWAIQMTILASEYEQPE